MTKQSNPPHRLLRFARNDRPGQISLQATGEAILRDCRNLPQREDEGIKERGLPLRVAPVRFTVWQEGYAFSSSAFLAATTFWVAAEDGHYCPWPAAVTAIRFTG